MSDHDCQSLFMVYDHGVVLIDAPPSYSAHIPQAIAEVSRNPVTHIIYLHSRADHIGGVSDIAGQPVIIAQDTTARLLESAADPRRPPPTVTFTNTFTLEAGDRTLELIHPGDADAPEGILVFAPAPRVLMVADLVFSSWRPWQRFARERDVSENAARLETIRKLPWIRLVSSIPGEILDPDDAGNQCLVNPCFH
jgi:glyoxylase-like metal-dependent hydrolase (beta-lactamase superfamily II)